MNAWVIFMNWSVRERMFVIFFFSYKINIQFKSTQTILDVFTCNYYHCKKILVTNIGNVQPVMNNLYIFLLATEKLLP